MDTNDEDYEVYEFGWWPEVVGAVSVAVLVWALIAFARGAI